MTIAASKAEDAANDVQSGHETDFARRRSTVITRTLATFFDPQCERSKKMTPPYDIGHGHEHGRDVQEQSQHEQHRQSLFAV